MNDKSFISQTINIDGVETNVVKKGFESGFLKSNEAYEYFDSNIILNIQYYPEICEKYNLHFGIVGKKFKSRSKMIYYPTLCMIIDDEFHHVFYKENWLCFECMCDNGKVLLPQSEGETIIYAGIELPKIPKIFTTQTCKECGRLLQGHILFLK